VILLSLYLVSHFIDEDAHEVRISLFPATQALVTNCTCFNSSAYVDS